MFERHTLNYNHRQYKFRNRSDPQVALLHSSISRLTERFFWIRDQERRRKS